MLQLRTLGRLDLSGESAQDYSSVLLHPKRLALLVYLAVARPAGFHRRDTILALLWPELDQERARASLRKAIYHIRRALGDSVIVGRGDEELAIDRALVACDAVQFDAALERGDAAAALDLYRGSFLDGFFVSGASGFEDWLERERRRLRDLAYRAAWQLAETAEQQSDTFAAAEWARRAAALLPDDETALRNLMQLLDRIGDRAGALATYEEFARRLQRDLEVEPDGDTQHLANRIRHRVVEPVASVATPTVRAKITVPRRHRMVAAIALMATALVAGVSGVRFIPPDVRTSARTIAVLPFTYQGHGELAYLGDGMVNLLATNLDQIGDFRTVDAAAVLNRISDVDAVDPIAGSNIAIGLGAGLFVTGDIVEANGKLRVSAGLFEVRGPQRARARASAEGDVSKLFEIIDAVTSQLIAGERRAPAERFTRMALLTTNSVAALKAYLQGEQLFRAGRYNEAVESFQRAVEADTTFALGYYRLALAHMWGSNAADREAAERAIHFGTRLASPDRALLEALVPFFRGDVDEAERQYRAILVRRPDESEVWYPLGETLFHHNPMRGRHVREARHPFEKALSLGPKDGPLTHLAEIAAIDRDYVAFDSLFTGIQPASHFYYVGEMVQAFRSGDAATRERMLNALNDSSDSRLVTASRHAMFLLEEGAYGFAVQDLMTAPGRPRAVRSWGYVHRAHLALSAGQFSAMRSEFARALPLDTIRALEHEAWLTSFPFVQASPSDLRALREKLVRLHVPPPPTTAEQDLTIRADLEIQAHVRLYLIGILSALLGDYSEAHKAAVQLAQLGGTPPSRDLAQNLAHAIRAEVFRLQGRLTDALAELDRDARHFDANRLNVTPFFAHVRERYIRAELLNALGRGDEAIGWYASFDEH